MGVSARDGEVCPTKPEAADHKRPDLFTGRRLHGGNFSMTVHKADFGAGGVIAIRLYRTFSLDSALRFTILERPAVGSARVSDRPGEGVELVHLAADRRAAEEWLSRHGIARQSG